jgi:multicomponent Na+:H+ antiporter subunit E
MKLFIFNSFLALVWAALTGVFTPVNFAAGFILGFIMLSLAQSVFGQSSYAVRGYKAVIFIFYFLWELLKANLRVAMDIVTPKNYMMPGLIRIPLEARSDIEISLLANIISLTPGSLCVDVSDDKKTMYVHAMYVEDADEFRREIKEGFERRLLEVLR